MAFKNLQQRYAERSKELYRGATYKFDGGKASSGANDDPLIVRKPGDGYWGTMEGRGLPVKSAAQDVKRLTLFTVSTRGIAFLAKQQLLQTGNTFARTRILNPTFVVANAVPFIRVQRNIDTSGIGAAIKSVLGITAIQNLISRPEPVSATALKELGRLQKETYKNSLDRWQLKNGTQSRIAFTANRILDRIPVVSQIRSAIPARGPLLAVGRTFVNNLLQIVGGNTLRPELGPNSIVESNQAKLRKYQDGVRQYFKEEFGDTETPFLKYFEGDIGAIRTLSQATTSGNPTAPLSLPTGSAESTVPAKKISYIKDPANITESSNPQTSVFGGSTFSPQDRLELYKTIPTGFDDLIGVSFQMGKDYPVQFRAFVSNINETVTPQYKEYQYIGRVERYISYVSVKRSVNFRLVVVAYSEEELDIVWKRINYLTSLTYPYGVYKGILQPNIIKLSLGDIYTDQPGYVTSVRSDFGGNISSWDIKKQVPHGATVDINFDIIEKKATTTAGTPLYGIVQP